MGYKTSTTKETRSFPDSSRDAIEDSRVYDHYDYAFDEFETYVQDDFESGESRRREVEIEKTKSPRRSTNVLHNTGCKEGRQVKPHPRWEKLNSEGALRENSYDWFSQAPFDLPSDRNASRKLWKLIQTDPGAWSRSRASQTHKVTQATVAAMAPDDLAAPARTGPINQCSNLTYSMFGANLAQLSQLKSFLSYAAYVIESLVSRSAQQASIGLRLSDVVKEDHSSDGRLTDGSMILVDALSEDFLVGRRVQYISFKESSSTTLLCCYGPSSSGSEHAREGCICIYNALSNPSLQFTLLLQGVPICASWSGYTQRNDWGIVVAGTQDGTLALWDLSSQPVGTLGPQFPLYPTYSTCYRIEDNHRAAIHSVSLYSNSMTMGANATDFGGGTSGSSLKLLSVDKLGFVHMWIVEEVRVKAARDDELGLHPDGRLCLVRTGTSCSVPRSADGMEIAEPETCRFAVIPGCVQEVLIALTDGSLVKTSLVGSKPCAPRKYYRRALKGLKPVASPVVSMCFSPFVEDCFLVAYADSTLAIFTVDKPHPWGVWTLPLSDSDGHIVSAQWSPEGSTIFFVAVSSRRVHVFDLSLGLTEPKFSETLQMDSSDEIVCFEMSNREAFGSRKPDMEYSFVTASVFGDVKLHLLKRNSDDFRTKSLKQVLLTS